MSPTEIDLESLRESFDWIYKYINNVKGQLKSRINDRQTVFALMISSYWATVDLANLIGFYADGDTSKANEIREKVEHVFKLLHKLHECDPSFFLASEAATHKHKLLGILPCL